MSDAMRSPPAASRVAIELLETLRALGVGDSSLVAVRAAVDRLRVLAMQLLVCERAEAATEDEKSALLATGEHAIAALASNAVEKLGRLTGDESMEALMATCALAFDLHRHVDALTSELFGQNQCGEDDKRHPEWLHDWQCDCCKLLVDRVHGWSDCSVSYSQPKNQPRWQGDGDADVREALVEVVERMVNSLASPSHFEALRTRLVAIARLAPLPTTCGHRHQCDYRTHNNQSDERHVLLAAARSDRLGVIPPHELVDGLDDSASALNQSGLRHGEWLGTRVAVFPMADASSGGFRVLFHLNHPNVLQLYGECERITSIGATSRVFVCEPVDGSLVQFLAKQARQPRGALGLKRCRSSALDDKDEEEGAETPRFVWRALLQAALALKFLHHRGIVRGDVTCGQILLGTDGVARLPAFSDLAAASSGDGAWWSAPERLSVKGNNRATFESDIFSFGVCIVEAVARWQHLTTVRNEPEREEDAVSGRSDHEYNATLPPREQSGQGIPQRPRRGLTDAQWEFVRAMCCAEPMQRMEMASVVHQIERFLSHEHFDHASHSALDLQTVPATANHPPYRIAEALDDLQTLVEQASPHDEDGREMTTHVLHRLMDAHAQLLAWAAQKMPRKRSMFRICGMSSDAMDGVTLERAEMSVQTNEELKQAITSFRTTLDHFYAFVEASSCAISAQNGEKEDDDDMLGLLCASRTKGAEEHFGFHTAIDQLLRRYLLSRSGGSVSAIHNWKFTWNQQRERQVERVKRRLQTLLLRSQHQKADNETAITISHVDDPSPPTPTDSESPTGMASRRSLTVLSASLGMPDWFTPPHEVLFDSRRPFSEGAFGSVHLGSWLDARVVIKKIKATASIERRKGEEGEEDAVFRREVGIWYALRHPHVVSLFGACYTSHERFFICEHAAQGQLSDYLEDVAAREGNATRVLTAWDKLLEASLGLQYLHARGVLHQDLKCDNILVTSDDRAKLTDFGLSASILRSHHRPLGKVVKSIGAPRWKAPEVLEHKPPTMESDVFSLGMCIVEAVSGKFPWGRKLPDAAVAFHVRRGKLPPVKKGVFSAGEWALVQEMCCLNSANRLPLESVVQALDAIVRKHRAAVMWA